MKEVQETFGARRPMIERYSDHAANERTHLAWVRTAIAIMALGFLVQKFDLFLRVAASSLAARPLTPRSQIVGDIAGLLLIERQLSAVDLRSIENGLRRVLEL